MMEFLEEHQLNIMLALSSICAMMTVLVMMAKALPRRRRFTLLLLELTGTLLISFDRLAYIYAGDMSTTGYWMVRISNFFVFFMTIGMVFAFNMYIADLLTDEGGKEHLSVRVLAVSIMCFAQMAFVIASQFTGWIYYIDEFNHYHRGSLFLLNYIIPVVAPLILFTIIMQYRKEFGKTILVSLILFIFVPMVGAIIQIFAYGLSIANMSMSIVAVLLFIFAYVDINHKVERANRIMIEHLNKGQRKMHKLLDQTTQAFVGRIEKNESYMQGHSARVAKYSQMIAERAGMTEDECDEVYYAALMHDMGDIADDIKDFPYMALGAKHRGRRFDGKDDPEEFVGKKIPRIARIITVAEAYDMMSSRTDFRDAMPQQVVREHFVENEGTLFDPKYAGIMTEIIDGDVDYQLKGTVIGEDASSKSEYVCEEYRDTVTAGIAVSQNVEKISFHFEPTTDKDGEFSQPSLIMFDSLDGRAHDELRAIEATRYMEYGELWFDGHVISGNARNMQMKPLNEDTSYLGEGKFSIEAAKFGDHVRLRLRSKLGAYEIITALPDSSRFAYIGITGEHCRITNISITKTDVTVGEDDIERIAEEISYINRLESDLPNVQVDGFCKNSTKGVPVTDGLRVAFHTMSLPAANLVWHCPYILIYHSDDGVVGGPNYREYALVRLDGEKREQYPDSENRLSTVKTDDFPGWDVWKIKHKSGLECVVTFNRIKNRITTRTENLGISITNTTIVNDGAEDIYMALTGDQVALTDIRLINR